MERDLTVTDVAWNFIVATRNAKDVSTPPERNPNYQFCLGAMKTALQLSDDTQAAVDVAIQAARNDDPAFRFAGLVLAQIITAIVPAYVFDFREVVEEAKTDAEPNVQRLANTLAAELAFAARPNKPKLKPQPAATMRPRPNWHSN
jgi:hypothetical protein